MSLSSQVRQQIEKLIQGHPVTLFMKGNREQPQCGFSAQVVQILDQLVGDYQTFDVFSDAQIREGIKEYASWPTIPQLYVRGEFVGGCDIVREMYESGELQRALGVPQRPAEPPKINITDAGAQAIRAAQRQSGGESELHLSVDARFRYRLGFGAQQAGELAAESNGIRVWISPESAARANGLTIDAAETPQGLRLAIDNPNEPKVAQLSPAQLAELRGAGTALELIDVRGPDERAQAQIQGSRLLDDATAHYLEGLPRDTKLVFHCHHGGRSQRAAEEYARRGFRDVNNLAGGIDAWSQQVDPSVPRY
jgi:monothiol glutaredoxin